MAEDTNLPSRTSDRHADWHSEHGSAQATFPISLEQREDPRDGTCHYDTSFMFVCLPILNGWRGFKCTRKEPVSPASILTHRRAKIRSLTIHIQGVFERLAASRASARVSYVFKMQGLLKKDLSSLYKDYVHRYKPTRVPIKKNTYL